MLNKLRIKNVIIYHTEEKHGEKRKELYIKETKKYYSGNIYVPNDLEIIDIWWEELKWQMHVDYRLIN